MSTQEPTPKVEVPKEIKITMSQVLQSNFTLHEEAKRQRIKARLPKYLHNGMVDRLAKNLGLVDYKGFWVPLVNDMVPEELMLAIDKVTEKNDSR